MSEVAEAAPSSGCQGDLLIDSKCSARIDAPIESIDLTQWLFSLTDAEYQACSRDHIAAGTSVTSDGRRMSINVERVGGDMLIEHYVEDVSEASRCEVVSTSDLFLPLGRTTIEIRWVVTVEALGPSTCQFTNRILGRSTPQLAKLFEDQGLDVRLAAPQMQANADGHNAEETPLFAKDIARKAARKAFR